MNVIKHRFASLKVDGADATKIQPSHWNDGHKFSGGAHGNALVRDTTDANFGAAWVPYGQWTNQPFSPASFHGNGGMTWNVSSVGHWAFMVLGQTCFYAWHITDATIGGTPNNIISFDTAPGCTPSAPGVLTAPCRVAAGSGTSWVSAAAYVLPNDPHVYIHMINDPPFTAGPVWTEGELIYRLA